VAENDVNILIRARDLTGRAFASAANGAAGLAKGMLPVIGGLAKIGAAGGAVNVLAGLGAAAAQAAPAVLILPAALAAVKLATATVTVGMQGFSEALHATGEDAAAFEEAISGLAPQAQETAREFRALRPAWDALQLDVQNALFMETGLRVRELGGMYLPILREEMVNVAEAFNSAAHDVADFFSEAEVRGDVAEGMVNLRQAIANTAEAAGPLVESFYLIGRVGSDFLPGLTDGFGAAAQRFREFIGEARRTGQLRDAIQGALDVLSQIGAVLSNIGQIAFTVFSGLSQSGGGFLETLEQLTGGVLDFLRSAEGMEMLSAIGETLRVVAGVMSDVLGVALRALGPIIVAIAPLIQTLAESFGTFLTGAIEALAPPLTRIIEALVGALQPILPIIADALVGLAEAIAPVIEAMAPLITILGEGLAQALELILPVLVEVARMLGEALVEVLNAVTPLLPPLIDAIMQLVAAVIPLIPPLVELSLTVVPIFIAILQALLPVVTTVIEIIAQLVAAIVSIIVPVIESMTTMQTMFSEAIGNVITWVVDFVNTILQWFQDLGAGMRETVGNAIDGVVQFFRDLPGNIMNAISGLGGQLYASGQRIVGDFLNGLKSSWDGVMGWINGAMGNLRAVFPFSPAKEGPFSGQGYVDQSGKALMGDFAESLRGQLPTVVRAATDVMGSVQGALSTSGVSTSAGAPLGFPTVSAQAQPAAVELRIPGGADSALASLLMRMVRSGELQLVAVS